MSDSIVGKKLKGAAEFDRPLLLTAAQDLKGFILSRLGRAMLFLIACTSVLAVLLIFYFVIQRSIPFFREYPLTKFLGSKDWSPTSSSDPSFGALTLVVGSFYVTIAALIFAVPVGILAALFLSDITSYRIRGIIKPVIELLAAIPSVAYGFFALLVFNPILQKHFDFQSGKNALNASIILAIMALPTIISVAEDSLTAVGRELREASYGLGATRMETLIKVVIPAGYSGIIAAVILGMMRAIGETMLVWMASGNATQVPHPWWDLSESIRTITATIAGEMGDTASGEIHRQSLFALGVVLLVLTFILNIVSEYFLVRAKKKNQGKI